MHELKIQTIGLIATLALAIATDARTESAAPEKPEPGNEPRAGLEKAMAASAIRAAAEEAAMSVAKKTRLDLDIRLIGPTSPTIAGTK